MVSAFAMIGPLQILGALSAILSMAMLAIAIFMRSSALIRLARLLRPVLVVTLAMPVLWMILQVAPIPVRGLGNPIWATASAALDEPLAARLTVDVRATMLSFAQYIAVIATALATAVLALERQRAAHTLYVLTSVGAFLSALLIWRTRDGLDASLAGEHALAEANGSVAAVLGILLATAMAIGTVDQLRHRTQPRNSTIAPKLILTNVILSMLLCMSALLASSNSTIIVATFLGAGTLVAVMAIRKWFFGPWGTAGVLATAIVLLLASFTVIPIKRNADLTIALSTQNQTATERMLQDTGLAGSGAGAFRALLPIYRDVGMSAMRERPTAAAAIAVGMGQPFIGGLLVVAMLCAFTLFRRSLSRSSDYIYPAVGAAASVSLPILALAEGGMTDLPASLLVAAVYGLAFGQSRSSGAREITSSQAQALSNRGNGRSLTGRPGLSTAFQENNIWVRIALMSIGIVLAAQAAWILSRPWWYFGDGVSIESAVDSGAWTHKNPYAISIEQSDRKMAQLKTAEGAASKEQSTAGPSAAHVFADALRYSPLRGDLWLMLAAMSKEYHSTRYDVVALLKLSYYTAPNDLELLPLRLSVGLGTNAAVREPELRELIKRDVKIAVMNRPALKPAVVAAYQSASVDGKIFADSVMSELDPSYVQNMRGRLP